MIVENITNSTKTHQKQNKQKHKKIKEEKRKKSQFLGNGEKKNRINCTEKNNDNKK